MKVNEKVQRVVIPAINSLADHEDADSVVLVAGLDAVIEYAQAKRAEVIAKNEAEAAAMFAEAE